MSLTWQESDNNNSDYLGDTERITTRLSRSRAGLTSAKIASFLAKIKIVNDCWLWFGARYPLGYGMFNAGRFLDGRQDTRYAHVLAFELANGPIPNGLSVLHSCDTPPCCRPEHLKLGTVTDNMRDRSARSPKWKSPAIPLDADTRRHILKRALSENRRGVIAEMAREYGVDYEKFRALVLREKRREFLANTTGIAAANR